MSEIKSLMDMLNDIEESSELMEVSDTFTFELGEEGDECLVETGVVACDDETVIVEADEQTLQILSEHFIIEDFEEMDEGNVLGFSSASRPMMPKQADEHMGDVLPFALPDQTQLYNAFKNSPEFPGNVGTKEFLQSAMKFIHNHEKTEDLNKIRSMAMSLLDHHLTVNEDLANILNFSGLRNQPAKDRPQKDRTDYDTPAFLRKADKTGKKLSPELDQLTGQMYNDDIRENMSRLTDIAKMPELDSDPILKKAVLAKLKTTNESHPHVQMRMGASSDASTAGSYKMGESEEVEENEDMDEAKYHGREVPLGKKMKGDVKKSKVYVRKPNGKIVKVNFGDKNMRIKKSNPKRRKSFRARHHCENPGPRWKARYWSCRSW